MDSKRQFDATRSAAMKLLLVCLVQFALTCASEMNDFSNVKLLSNPIKTKKFSGNLSRESCDFDCPLLYQHMDITQGVWQIKVDSVLFVKDDIMEIATVFDIKTDLLMTYDTLANVITTGPDCRFPTGAGTVCPQLAMFEGYPAIAATQQTIWSKDIAMTSHQKFIFINSAQSASEWYTVDAPKLNGFRIIVQQRPSVSSPLPHNLKVEINFLFRRMK